MYYSIFEAIPNPGKEDLAGTYYKSLLPHLHKVSGFREDAFSFATNIPRQGVNIAIFEDLDAIKNWRNEEHHLRMQGKGADVYESYRIRIGRELAGDEVRDGSDIRHYLTLFYSDNTGESKPQDAVTGLVEDEVASKLKNAMLESTVYQGTQTVWVSSWRSTDALALFERSIPATDRLVQLQVLRDYAKNERADAPHQVAGTL